jgi:hypothetical protein
MIYGSTAIKHWFPDFSRTPADLDILSDTRIVGADTNWHPLMEQVLAYNSDPVYLDPNLLLTFKLSHLSYPIQWDKHMKDAIFLANHNCKVNLEAYHLLMQIWEDVHSAKYGSKHRITLAIDNHNFFTERVPRKFDHDSLHEHFAFYDRPLHERIRPSHSSPLPSKTEWGKLSPQLQLQCALEEIYVITYERSYSQYGMAAIVRSTKHLITSMTKGWFNLFMKQHFLELIHYDHTHFYSKLAELYHESTTNRSCIYPH